MQRTSFGESLTVLALLIHLNIVNENERVHLWNNAYRSLNQTITFLEHVFYCLYFLKLLLQAGVLTGKSCRWAADEQQG